MKVFWDDEDESNDKSKSSLKYEFEKEDELEDDKEDDDEDIFKNEILFYKRRLFIYIRYIWNFLRVILLRNVSSKYMLIL